MANLIIQIVVCCCVVAGFFAMTALYVFNADAFAGPAEKQLTLITGAFIGAFGQVVNWAISSTIGSQRKTELLARAEPVINLGKPIE